VFNRAACFSLPLNYHSWIKVVHILNRCVPLLTVLQITLKFISNFNQNLQSLDMIMYLKKHFLRVYNAGICYKMVYLIHVDEQKLSWNHIPLVWKCTKKLFFSNLLNLILARKYNFLIVYNHTICFSSLLIYHSYVQSLN